VATQHLLRGRSFDAFLQVAHIGLPSHSNASTIQSQCKLPVTDGEQQWQIDWDTIMLLLLFKFCVST
jgi:hypothetical protein